MLGGHGGAPPAQSGGIAPAGSSVVVRKVTLPEAMLVGSPSADGKLFSLSDITGNVAVVDLATGEARRLTNDAVLEEKGSQYAEFSAISVDNRFVAYSWYALDGKYEIRIVDVEGKRARVLLRNDAVDYPMPIEWSRDGKWILATLMRPDHSAQLALVSVDDGTVRPLKELGSLVPQHASLSPDGQFVVYDAPQVGSATGRGVFIIRTDGSDDRRLVEGAANNASPVWTPDGRRVLFASDRSGTMDVWSVDVERGVAQGAPQLVHRSVGRMWLRGLTDTGSYFYYATVGAVDVYQAELTNAGVKNPVTLPATHAGSNISSIWSPDGRRLAYASRRGLIGFDRGSTTLAILDLETNQQRELVPALNSFLLRSWSPDGRLILVNGQDTGGQGGTYHIDAETGKVTPLTLAGRPSNATDIRRGDFMPDGRVLLFSVPRRALIARNAQTGAEEVVFDLKAEGIELVSDVVGRGYKLSPDGQMIAVTSATREGDVWTRSLGVKVLGGGPSRELAKASGSEMIRFQDWTPDGGAVIFTKWITKPNEPMALWRVSIHGGDPQPLGLSMPGIRDVSVHPNGRKITFTAGWPMNELWVMENFLTDK